MAWCRLVLLFTLFSSIFALPNASDRDVDSIYKEEKRQKLGLKPIKYHENVHFNMFMEFRNLFLWLSLLSILPYNSVARDVDLTEILDHSSAVALLGFSLILAILRTFNVQDEAAKVMVAAPIIAFVTTHILYLNFYQLDTGLNRKVCFTMVMATLTVWGVWARVSRHPSRWKLWVVVIGGAVATLVEIFDFAPYWGYVDAHAVWHATCVPLTYLLWSFVRDDSEFRTTSLSGKKAK